MLPDRLRQRLATRAAADRPLLGLAQPLSGLDQRAHL
jgi:hypothetical protein